MRTIFRLEELADVPTGVYRLDTEAGSTTPASGLSVTQSLLAVARHEQPAPITSESGLTTLYAKRLGFGGEVVQTITLTALPEVETAPPPSGTSVALPEVTEGDEGKVLAVTQAADGFELGLRAPLTRLGTTPLALADAVTPQTFTAGPGSTFVDFTDCALTVGEDYWGDPGSALPLTLVGGSGGVTVPSDRIHDIQANVGLTADPADEGKLVGFVLSGPLGSITAWIPVLGGGVVFSEQVTCRVFAGGPDTVQVAISTDALAHDLTLDQARFIVTERV